MSQPVKTRSSSCGEGDEVLDEGGAVVGALAEADGAHLGEGADGLGEAAADGFDAGDEGGGDGSHAGDHDAEFSCGRLDAGRLLAVRLLVWTCVVLPFCGAIFR